MKIHLEEDIKSKLEKEIYKNVSINGKVDLHIETEDKEILVDYKSGKDTKGNKIRAFNQLNYYFSILPKKDKKTLEKWVINTWNGEKEENIEIKEEEIFTRENIKKVIKEYYETDYYDLGDKKDKSYEDIARREDELGDE